MQTDWGDSLLMHQYNYEHHGHFEMPTSGGPDSDHNITVVASSVQLETDSETKININSSSAGR